MKIKVSEPDGPYSAELDPGVMNVTLEEVFNGVKFVTKDGECLSVCMRDSGFEVHYFSENKVSRAVSPAFDTGWIEFKRGVVKTSDNVDLLEDE